MNARRLRLMLGLLRQNIAAYIGAIGSTIMTVSIGFITPLLLAETIDAIIGTHPLHAPAWIVRCFEAIGGRIYVANHLWIVALLLMGLTAVNGIFMFIKGKTSALASENVALSLRERLYNHLQHLTYNYHVKAETGDLIQRCTSDVDTIRRFLSMQLVEVVNAVLMVIIALTIMLGKHVKLALLSILLVPLLFLFAFAFFKLVMKHFRISDEAEGRMSAVLQENLTAVRVVRAFGRQHYEVEKFET
ncbi:MAG: ABC transporter transmembrane domain-containing protein, partial [Clostridia bacterium]